MKFAKRILASLVTLALMFLLALPSMAAVNWDEFKFTEMPKDITIKYGDSFTLSVEVKVPDGAVVEYQWYCRTGESGSAVVMENETSRELHLSPGDVFYPSDERLGGASVNYGCEITAYDRDSETSKYLGCSADVFTKRTALGKLYDLTVTPFVYAFESSVAILSMTMGILLPAVPLVFLGALIYGFIQGFGGLFS